MHCSFSYIFFSIIELIVPLMLNCLPCKIDHANSLVPAEVTLITCRHAQQHEPVATTEMIFRSLYLSRSVLDPGLKKTLVPG